MVCHEGFLFKRFYMTDEQRLQIITDQLILVRDNLFRGMSKSIQKLQARSINEVLELENYIRSPQRKPLTDEEIWACLPKEPDEMAFARAIEAAHGII